MTLYHVTTPRKMQRYLVSGCILPPVRGRRFIASAEAWARKIGRTVILKIDVVEAYPLPDHGPSGHAWWSPEIVRSWS